MIRHSLRLKVGILIIGIVLFGHASQALCQAKLSGWEQTAFQYFRNDKFPEALKAMESRKQERFAKILTTFVHTQDWVYSQNKAQKALWQGEYKSLVLSVGIHDIPYIALITEEKDKPVCVKYAKKLLKRAFENIYNNEDVPMLVDYLPATDQDVCRYAAKTLNRILKNRRKVVKDGGSLRTQDIKMMKDKALLSQLTANVSQQAFGGKQPGCQKGISEAINSLVYIEEPSMEYLDQVSGANVSKAKVKVQKAMNKRTKKFLKSNWYSAIGKERE